MEKALDKIIHAGPLRESLWLYTFSAAMRIVIGMARVLLLTWLIQKPSMMGLWGTAIMGMVVLWPVMNLGLNHGLTRYVSVYEATGRLKWFFRRAFIGSLIITAVTCVIVFAFRAVVADVLYPPEVGFVANRMLITDLIIANVFGMGCFTCMLGLMNGLRIYRLMSLIEVGFSVLFTIILLTALCMEKSIAVMLTVHLGCIVIMLVIGVAMLAIAVGRLSESCDVVENSAAPEFTPVDGAVLLLRQLCRFGLGALAGALAWQIVTYASYYMSYRRFGSGTAGEFSVTLRLAQPLYTLALAAWAVAYAHVARLNQRGEATNASGSLDLLFRVISWPMQVLACVMVLTSCVWVKVLGDKYQVAPEYLPGLVMMFMAMGNSLLLGTASKVRGRLMSFVLAALAAMVFNVLFFYREVFGCSVREISSMAAGMGVWAGAMFVSLMYILRWRIKLSPGSWVLMLLPAIYIFSGGKYMAAGLLAAIFIGRVVFSRNELGKIAEVIKEFRTKLARP